MPLVLGHLTGCPFFAPRLLHSRLLPKCQILLTKVAIYDIMVKECTLVHGQTTRGGGYLYAAGSAQTTTHMKQQDMIQQQQQQEPDYCQILTHSQIRLRAHAAGQYPSRLLIRLRPGRQTTNTYHPRLLYARMQQDERRGRRASTLRQP